jgi:hypothetical protein
MVITGALPPAPPAEDDVVPPVPALELALPEPEPVLVLVPLPVLVLVPPPPFEPHAASTIHKPTSSRRAFTRRA